MTDAQYKAYTKAIVDSYDRTKLLVYGSQLQLMSTDTKLILAELTNLRDIALQALREAHNEETKLENMLRQIKLTENLTPEATEAITKYFNKKHVDTYAKH